MRTQKHSIARQNAVLRMYTEEGLTLTQIAEKLQRSERQVRRILSEAGVEFKPGRGFKLVDSEVARLYKMVVILRKMSMDEAAAVAGVVPSTLRRRFRAYADSNTGSLWEDLRHQGET